MRTETRAGNIRVSTTLFLEALGLKNLDAEIIGMRHEWETEVLVILKLCSALNGMIPNEWETEVLVILKRCSALNGMIPKDNEQVQKTTSRSKRDGAR